MPTQISEDDVKNLEKGNEAFDTLNLVVLVVMICLNNWLAGVLGSIKVVHFFSYLLAVQMVFPAMTQKYFTRLLKIQNFDLLEQFPFFDIPYYPKIKFSNELSSELGFVGFDNCTVLLNLGTLCWLALIYIVYLCSLGLS